MLLKKVFALVITTSIFFLIIYGKAEAQENYSRTNPLSANQIVIQNNYKNWDSIQIKGLQKGDIVQAFTKDWQYLTSGKSVGNVWTGLYVKQLGEESGQLRFKVKHPGELQSYSTLVSYEAEPRTAPLSLQQVYVKNNFQNWDAIQVKNLPKGEIVEAYTRDWRFLVKGISSGDVWTGLYLKQLGNDAGQIRLRVQSPGKRQSYSIVVSYSGEPRTDPLNLDQVDIKNNYQNWDVIQVKSLTKGEIVRAYTKDWKYLTQSTSIGNLWTGMYLKQLGEKSSQIRLKVQQPRKLESYSTIVSFKGEPRTEPISNNQVVIDNNTLNWDTIQIRNLQKGDIIRAYTNDWRYLTSTISLGNLWTGLYIKQLGINPGKIRLTIQRSGQLESYSSLISYKGEIPPSRGDEFLQYTGYVNTANLNIRSGPGSSYSVINTLNENNIVTVIDEEIIEINKDSKELWLKIKVNNKVGYVSGKYIIKGYPSSNASVPPVNTNSKKGLDVSHWQGSIDYSKVKANGYQFVIAKATDGQSYIDSQFNTNMVNAARAGLTTNAYHFFRADSINSAIEEAHHFINTLSKAPITGYVFLDVEDPDPQHGITLTNNANDLTRYVDAFLNEVYLSGYHKIGIYTGFDFYYNRLIPSNLPNNALLWISRYRYRDEGWDSTYKGLEMPADIWQYRSDGSVSGVEGNVDIDVSYFDNF